jgi:hypothetical protein
MKQCVGACILLLKKIFQICYPKCNDLKIFHFTEFISRSATIPAIDHNNIIFSFYNQTLHIIKKNIHTFFYFDNNLLTQLLCVGIPFE